MDDIYSNTFNIDLLSLLVQHGTLHVGDPIVVGNTFGRVRTMTDARGRSIKKATPATPVEITGLNDVPDSSDRFIIGFQFEHFSFK